MTQRTIREIIGPPEKEEGYTIGELYGPAMEIADEEEANEYLTALTVESHKQSGKTHDACLDIQRHNLGYFAGYYDKETAERVFKLFNCHHPIFGTEWPTPAEAFEAGKKLGEKMKEKEDAS
jgi:hypothetical protein